MSPADPEQGAAPPQEQPESIASLHFELRRNSGAVTKKCNKMKPEMGCTTILYVKKQITCVMSEISALLLIHKGMLIQNLHDDAGPGL